MSGKRKVLKDFIWGFGFYELLATAAGQARTHVLRQSVHLTLWDSEGGKEPQKVHCWCVLSFAGFFFFGNSKGNLSSI